MQMNNPLYSAGVFIYSFISYCPCPIRGGDL